MRGYFLVLIFGILATVSLGFGQGASRDFTYYDDGLPPLEPPITFSNGQPVPDGTPIGIVLDLGPAGPDPSDSLVSVFHFNGEALGSGPGYFSTSVDSSVIHFDTTGFTVYLAVAVDTCWYTVGFPISPGYEDIYLQWSDWTSTGTPCPWVGQPAVTHFYYCPEPSDPALGCPCEDPTPFFDGTLVCFFHDINLNGPDDSDTLVSCSSLYYEGNCWRADGYPMIALPDTGIHVFLMVNGDTCCWTTIDYVMFSSFHEIWIAASDWTCVNALCMVDSLPSAHQPAQVPASFGFSAIYPNPFNSVTQIELSIPQTGPVTVEIFNLAGQHIRTLARSTFTAGVHHLTWDARSDANLSVGSGVYLCRASTHGASVTRKLLLLQ